MERDTEIAARWPTPTGAENGTREKQSKALRKGKGEPGMENGTQSTGSERTRESARTTYAH